MDDRSVKSIILNVVAAIAATIAVGTYAAFESAVFEFPRDQWIDFISEDVFGRAVDDMSNAEHSIYVSFFYVMPDVLLGIILYATVSYLLHRWFIPSHRVD